MTMPMPESHPETVLGDPNGIRGGDQEGDERPRKVKFNDVEVIMCSLRLSGNPSCSDYVALELDKEVGRDEKISVEEYELSRPECRRRRDTDLRLSRFEREEILYSYDYSRQDVEDFVMELRAELRAYEEAERTRASGILHRARNMMGSSSRKAGNNDDDDDDSDNEAEDESASKGSDVWTRFFSKNKMNSALDVVDIHRHHIAESAPESNNKKNAPRRSNSGGSGSGSISSQSESYFSGNTSTGAPGGGRKLTRTRALVLKAATEELTTTVRKSTPGSDRKQTDGSSTVDNASVVSKESASIVSKGSVSVVSKGSVSVVSIGSPSKGSVSVSSSKNLSKSLFGGKKKEKSSSNSSKTSESAAAKKKNNAKKAADLYLMSGTSFGPLGAM